MVTRRLAEALLRAATRRWPAEYRDELGREWSAELHVLAAQRQRLRMLRYAASLAASRPDGPLAGPRAVRGRAGRTAAALLLAPVAGVGIVLVSAVVMAVVVNGFLATTVSWSTRAQLPVLTVLTAALALLLARFAARWGRRSALAGPLRTALGVMLPVGVTAVLLEYVLNRGTQGLIRVAPGLVSWLTLLTLVLWGASALAGRGRVRAAWWVGVLGALVVADVSVVLTVVNAIPAGPQTVVDGLPQADTVDRISAPLWLFASWTDWSFGLPRPTPWELFLITDLVEVQPYLYLAVSPYALAYAVNAARSAPPADAAPPAGLPA
ncbi:hypothetical protein [Micromonospora globbae]|uniref:hypothetical protein n=1 Tax=Micromonospora globbae TaxID=1894969 RepID=UPI00343D116A